MIRFKIFLYYPIYHQSIRRSARSATNQSIRSSNLENHFKNKKASLDSTSFDVPASFTGTLVAEAGLEPATSGLWARQATNCSTPRYKTLRISITGARGRNRTGTKFDVRRILSPLRLPVPPLEHFRLILLSAWLCYHSQNHLSNWNFIIFFNFLGYKH